MEIRILVILIIIRIRRITILKILGTRLWLYSHVPTAWNPKQYYLRSLRLICSAAASGFGVRAGALYCQNTIVNPRKLEHEFRMIRAGIHYTLL